MKETSEQITIRFEVKDTGVGISEKAQARLFQAFSQADSSTTRKYGGTGLGLVICQRLVEKMNGDIGVTSLVGKGSTFWFTATFRKQATERPSNYHPTPLQGLRVAFVDEHPINQQLLTQHLTSWGITSVGVSTPNKMISVLKESMTNNEPFDMVILSRVLPTMDGLALAQAIKSESTLSSLPLVLLTSLGQRGEAQKAQDVGFSGYLTKPIRKAQLHDCLSSVMGFMKNSAAHPERPAFVTKHTLQEIEMRKGCRILVADDHSVNQQLAVMMLKRLGYRAEVVNNGAEALEALTRIPFSLVFMDCQMPEMDGYEATKKIREAESKELGIRSKEQEPDYSEPSHSLLLTPYCSRIPIIAMTANAMEGDRQRCLDAGMDDYISKPIRKEALEVVLENWLAASKSNLPEATQQGARSLDDRGKISSTASTGPQRETLSHQPIATIPPLSPINDETLEVLQSLGGEKLVSKMIEQFVRDVETCVSALESALADHETAKSLDAVHGLKGICANMGVDTLRELSQHIELSCREGKVIESHTLFEQFKTELKQVVVQFQHQNIGTPLHHSSQD